MKKQMIKNIAVFGFISLAVIMFSFIKPQSAQAQEKRDFF